MFRGIISRRPQFSKQLTEKIKSIRSMSSSQSEIKESQIKVDEQTLNYVKVGKGDHHLLCFPGSMGTIWSDFKPQVERLDKNKFTIVAWDPPGYGRSRPPKRTFPLDFYIKDADFAYRFMKEIGINKYSLLGWSDGGISGMILAAKYPNVMRKLVIWGSNAYVLPEEIKSYEKIRDIKNWSEKMKAPLIKLYTEEGLQRMWGEWCDTLMEINERGGDICKKELASIKCPTLILHGNLDPLVLPEHPTYLLENIRGSKIYNFPEGKHNIHLRYPDKFNAIISQFLEEQNHS